MSANKNILYFCELRQINIILISKKVRGKAIPVAGREGP
jgi:hypothetical protein